MYKNYRPPSPLARLQNQLEKYEVALKKKQDQIMNSTPALGESGPLRQSSVMDMSDDFSLPDINHGNMVSLGRVLSGYRE